MFDSIHYISLICIFPQLQNVNYISIAILLEGVVAVIVIFEIKDKFVAYFFTLVHKEYTYAHHHLGMVDKLFF